MVAGVQAVDLVQEGFIVVEGGLFASQAAGFGDAILLGEGFAFVAGKGQVFAGIFDDTEVRG